MLTLFLFRAQDDVNHIRSTYDAFFGEYPLCYGYWKKYAEAERRHGSNEAATAVYERGCAATPYSTDLWVAYAAFLLASDATTNAVRRWARITASVALARGSASNMPLIW